MILHKLSAFSLVVWLFLQTIATTTPTSTPEIKSNELTPELKQNALKLLSALARETQQFNLPENRVRTQTIVADLLWEHDEREARAIFQNALVELQNLFGQLDAPEGAEMNSTEQTENYSKRYSLAELRREYVLTLAPHDPQTALAALKALKIKQTEEYDPLAASELELQIASAIAKKDPDKAYALAKEQIGEDGITYQLVEALKELHKKNSEIAAKLGKDVLAKIKNAKIRTPSAATGNMSNMATMNTNTTSSSAAASRPAQNEIDFWQVSSFVNAASELNRAAARDKEKKMVALLSEAEMKELVDLIARAFLSERNPAPYSISQVMPEISRYAPAQAQRIRLKMGAEAARQLDTIMESSASYSGRSEKSAEELAQDAERAALDVRDTRYSEAVYKALEENDPEKAQAIAARIKDRKSYGYLFEQIETALPLAKARRGDLEEVRKMLAGLKTNQERIATLTELAAAIAVKGDKETAKKLLDESLQMMPARLRKQADLESAGKVAAVYALAAPDEAFTIVENSIGQMNEYINAGILLDEFYDYGSVERDELLYNSMERQALLHLPNSVDLMKNLARSDFERAVNLADKFGRPETRLLVRLRIAQSLLDAEAAEKEKKMREQIESEEHGH
jgi:hypothetical protein